MQFSLALLALPAVALGMPASAAAPNQAQLSACQQTVGADYAQYCGQCVYKCDGAGAGQAFNSCIGGVFDGIKAVERWKGDRKAAVEDICDGKDD